MRLFVALDLDDATRERLKTYSLEMRECAPDARWVSEASFHVTLKFIGHWDSQRLEELQAALIAVKTLEVPLHVRGCGFFPSRGSARVFWAGVEEQKALTDLAANVDRNLNKLGVAANEVAYHPHITLARSGSGSPNRGAKDRANSRFRALQEKLASMPTPEFGSLTASEFFLYESKLTAKGSIYTKLERFPLRATAPSA